jgi:biotin operon repressor
MEYPPHLIEAFKKLTNDFENAIRADERKRLLVKFRAEFPSTGNNTDMHGMPLQESRRQPSGHLPRSLARMLHVLQVRPYPVTLTTLARECRTTKSAAAKRLSDLRRRGYVIRKSRTPGHKIANYSLAANQ